MSLYTAIRYDTWGNKKDGFEVNDKHKIERNIEIDDDISDKKLIKEIRKIFDIPRVKIEIEQNDEYAIYINLKDGEYYGELLKQDEYDNNIF